MSNLEDLRIDTPPPKPRRRAYFPWFPVVVTLFSAVVILWLLRGSISLSGGPAAEPASQNESVPTAAASAQPAGPPGSISAAGYLEVMPPGPTVVSSLVSGRVGEVLVVPGEEITAGQLVAVLDDSGLKRRRAIVASRVALAQSRLDRLSAGFRSEEIAQQVAAVDRAHSAMQLALTELTRAEDLHAKGVVAGQELDLRRAEYDQGMSRLAEAESRLELLNAGTRSEDLSVAKAELSASRAELAQVDWEIGQCRILAPAESVVLELFIQPGDWLTPGTDNPRSSAVLSSFDPRAIQAWVDVNQRDSAALSVGQGVELATDAYPGRKVMGSVSRIMPKANLQKNTVQVKVGIPDPPPDFRPELSVKVTFLPVDETGDADFEEAGNE